MTAEEIGARARLDPDPAERLLRAAASLKLVVRNRNGSYRLGELGAAMRGAQGVREIVRHNQVFYRDLSDPVALLRGEQTETELSKYWPYAEGDEAVSGLDAASTSPYTALMAASQPFIADDVIAAYDFSKHRALLDLGGGDGTFVRAVGRAYADLKIGVFDLPSVAEEATRKFAAEGFEGRAEAHGGDFHRDTLPAGFDAISLVRILLDHDDATAERILTAAKAALPPGGTVIVAELMSEAPGAETISDAYFGLYLFAMGRGRPRSAERISALMQSAGLVETRAISTRRALMTQLVVGRVPSN
jgi:demethylspheroidene O-methyltransferase